MNGVSNRIRGGGGIGFVVALLLIGVNLSADGLWIDEITTALLAQASTGGEFLEVLARTGSEMQMPLFSVYAWLWGQTVGTSEILLRLMNLPWILLTVWSFDRLLCRFGYSRMALGLLFLPFVGSAFNEARPYAMTLAGSFLALEAWTAATASGGMTEIPRAIRLRFIAGWIVTLGSSLLNGFWVPALVLGLALETGFHRRGRSWAAWIMSNRGLMAASLAILGAFAVYYAGTLWMGYGGQKQALHPANLGFAAYELMGFGGWGPPRHLMRESAAQFGLWQPFLPGLGLGIVLWLGVGILALGGDPARRRAAWRWWGMAAVGAACLVTAAFLAPASIWGRHFTVFYPFLLMGLAAVMGPVPFSVKTGWLLMLLVGWGWGGSLRLRLLPVYAKDPYREVCALLNTAAPAADVRNPPVYWVAAPSAPRYYPLAASQRLILGVGWSAESVRARFRDGSGGWLVVHRPDKFDPAGAWSPVMAAGRCVWEKQGLALYWIDSAPAARGK